MEEEAFVLTDKNLYLTGEEIYFSTGLYSSTETSKPLSTIIYVEFITPSGKPVIAIKIPAKSGYSNGIIDIPENISSGYYYLRAYSKSMRNSDPHRYAYSSIKIVNPVKKEVLEENGGHEENLLSPIKEKAETDNLFEITLERDKYRVREQVQIRITSSGIPDSLLYSSISVIPEHSIYIFNREIPEKENTQAISNIYNTEIKGLSISGIVENEPGHDLSVKSVNLTLLGENKNVFYPIPVDQKGRFVFTLPELYSRHDMFVSIDTNSGNTRLLIDNDFCSKNIDLPSPVFSLSDKEEKMALQAAVNLQIKEHFNTAEKDSKLIKQAELFSDTIPFYGKPGQSVYIENYIDLPYLSDYFLELNVPVRIKHEKNEISLSIISEDPTINLYPPLVMVDYVPVYDRESFLKINPKKVLRFDLMNSPYQRGEFIYGGILNVISKNNDFTGIKLPETGIFLDYQFLTPSMRKASWEQAPGKDQPDTRNTLYWNPEAGLRKNGESAFSFYTADTKGTYLVKVSAITKKGEIIECFKRFEVE
ncbi:MAG: hypothetical protein ACOCWA_06400 [Bacteroidota bacterium]